MERNIRRVSLQKATTYPSYYHTIFVPFTSSCGEKQLLPLETRILQPKKSITCCASKYTTKLRKLDRDPKQKYCSDTLLLSSRGIWKQGRFCKCEKTSLHFAIKEGWVDKVEELLNEGASLGAKDDFGKVPIQYIRNLTGYDSRRILDVIWLRIIEKPDVEIELLEATGLSLIHLACLRDDLWAVKRLLKKDKSLMSRATFSNCHRWSSYFPLHFAVVYSSAELVLLLLMNNADPNSRDRYGYTPVHLAIQHGKCRIFHLLVDYGADPYARSRRHLTPLRLALQAKCQRSVEAVLLYTRGNPMDNKGSTPLHYCCEKKLYQKVRNFLGNGIYVDSKRHLFASKMPGFTPLHVAVKKKDVLMMLLLLSHSAHVYEFNSHFQTIPELIHCSVKDEKLKKQMINIFKDFGFFQDLSNNFDLVPWWNSLLTNAANEDSPVVIEINPELADKHTRIVNDILQFLPYKKFIALSRKEIGALFFDFNGNQEVNKTTLQSNGTFLSKTLCRSYNHQDRKEKNLNGPIYHYYMVNHLALKVLIDFGFELGEDTNEMEFTYHMDSLYYASSIYIFLKNMEIRRLLGFGGKNQLLWKRRFEEQDILSMFEDESVVVEDLPELVSRESNLMKKWDLGPNAGSLFDVLKDEHKFAQFLYREPNFINYMKSGDFSEKLPNCRGVVRMKFLNAAERVLLIKPAIDKLSEMVKHTSGIDWLEDCSDCLLPYLSDKDLKNLIQALER